MQNHPNRNKTLLTIAAIFLSLTTLLTLTGGIGTWCVAFNAETVMEKMVPAQPVLKPLVLISILDGLFGVYVFIALIKGWRGVYRNALLFLLVGGGASAVQFYFSYILRDGKTAPNSMRLYLTLLTLLIFLFFRLPGIWEKTGHGFLSSGKPGGTSTAAGAALVLTGILTLTTPFWAASTHIFAGYNTVNDLLLPLVITGSGLLFFGLALLLHMRFARPTAEGRQRAAGKLR